MSKLIKPTAQDIEKLKEDFARELASGKWENGKVNFQATLGSVNRKAKLHFTDIAWRKMLALVSEYSSEIGWHGVAYRDEDEEKDEYYVDDIMVYPQEVTGSTVTTDQVEYQNWLYSFEDDVFNNIRFQGHSHVNMTTTPSSVDWNLYKSILSQLDDESFYIFVIWNKSNARTVLIYDMKKNVLFETADVTVDVLDEDGFYDFLKDAKEKVKTKTYSYSASNTKVAETKNEKEVKDFSEKKDTKPAENKKDTSKKSSLTPYNYHAEDWDEEWDDDYSYYGYSRRTGLR